MAVSPACVFHRGLTPSLVLYVPLTCVGLCDFGIVEAMVFSPM